MGFSLQCAPPSIPEGGHAGALAERGLGDVVLQVLVEVALVAVLAHHEGQLGVEVGAHQPGNVRIPDGGQDPRLRLEIQPARLTVKIQITVLSFLYCTYQRFM